MNFKISRTLWAISFACLSMFVLGMSDNIRGPLFPELLNHFSLSNAQGSFSFAAASAAGLLGNIVAGQLLNRMTLGRLLSLSVFIMGLGLLMMGLAPSFFMFLVGSAVFGGSMGLVGLTQNVLVTESAKGKSQSKSLAGLHGIYGLSSLLAPLVASYSALTFGSWRAAFFVTAVIAGVISFLAAMAQAVPKFEVHRAIEKNKQQRTSKKALLLLGGVLAFYVVAEILVSSRLALYMRSYFDKDLKESSLYVTSFFVCLLAGRLLFAVKAFSISLKSQLNISLVASLICLLLGLLLHPLFLVVLGFTMAPFYPISLAYISEQAGMYQREFITFALSFQSFCIIAMHLGVGYLTDTFGLFYAFTVGLLALVFALICVNFHPQVTRS